MRKWMRTREIYHFQLNESILSFLLSSFGDFIPMMYVQVLGKHSYFPLCPSSIETIYKGTKIR